MCAEPSLNRFALVGVTVGGNYWIAHYLLSDRAAVVISKLGQLFNALSIRQNRVLAAIRQDY